MLLIALKSPKDAELRKRILGKLTADGDKAKYDNVVSDLQMFLSTIAETTGRNFSECTESTEPSCGAPVDVNGKPIDFVFDPGAEITVIDEEAHLQIGRPRLIQCSESAKYHDGTECTLLGKGFATFTFGGRTHEGQFYVTKKGSLNLLGIDILDAFGLLDTFKPKLRWQ
ncbi:hypothetical protein niasHS_008740 [Heterodera schachtii]|uniref:Peptidase A2 domain-containing protein n=1 Tax=Heterodera schachtii TaxID=97005 RepID=A0ABD2J2Z0_HETSC